MVADLALNVVPARCMPFAQYLKSCNTPHLRCQIADPCSTVVTCLQQNHHGIRDEQKSGACVQPTTGLGSPFGAHPSARGPPPCKRLRCSPSIWCRQRWRPQTAPAGSSGVPSPLYSQSVKISVHQDHSTKKFPVHFWPGLAITKRQLSGQTAKASVVDLRVLRSTES